MTATAVIATAIVVLVVKQQPAPLLIVDNAQPLRITPDSSPGP